MSHNLTRVESSAIVEQIAAANHVPFTHTAYAASVELGEVVYFWAAA
jgi:hypothetical protein